MARFGTPRVIKKYGNRRLYDTTDSHYLTQDELAAKIGSGEDVRVVDARSGRDLTQATLTQMLFEGRGASAVLPVAMLHSLVRMPDAELAEFLGRRLPVALERYLAGDAPPVSLPAYGYAPSARGYEEPESVLAPRPQTPSSAARFARPEPALDTQTSISEIVSLRRELDELKTMIREVASHRAPGASAPRRARKRRAS